MTATGRFDVTERQRSGQDPMAAERDAMVALQIEARDVSDPAVLAAMRKVPRHLFVPENLRSEAYSDEPLPIGYGQTISQPYIVAYMTERLGIKPADRVLEIGTGSGYQTAVLAELAKQVFTVELIGELADTAHRKLDALGYRNICFRTGNGWKGWPEEAPFDKILVTAAPKEIPEPLVAQLKEGGKIIIPVGIGIQELIEGEKQNEILKKHNTISVRFVPLLNPEEKESC